MSTKIASIARNTSYFTLALILQKVISFTYFAILARNLMPEQLGKYYFAISFTTIFAIFIDLGLGNVLVREVAKAKERAGEFLGTVLAIKIPLMTLALLTVAVLINLMGYPELTRHLVYISSISMVLDSFTLTFYAVVRGHHNLGWESIGSIVFQLIAMGVGLVALKTGASLKWVISAMAFASTFNFLYSLTLTRFKYRIKLLPHWNFPLLRSMVLLTIPFALFAVFQRVYMYLDTVLLSLLADDRAVGLYQIAFKIVFALQFLPMAFIASLYPALASYWSASTKASADKKESHSHNEKQGDDVFKPKEQLVITFERAMNYLIIISLPISLGIMTLADKIILIFKPEYLAAVLPLQIIIASLPFIFLNFPIGAALNACDRQKLNTLNMGIALTVSIIMNIILIPRLGVIGACLTVLITNLLMFIIGMSIVPRIIEYRPQKIISVLYKVVISVIAMSLLIIYLKASLSILILVPLGAIIYFGLMFVLGGIKKEDILSIYKSFVSRTTHNS